MLNRSSLEVVLFDRRGQAIASGAASLDRRYQLRTGSIDPGPSSGSNWFPEAEDAVMHLGMSATATWTAAQKDTDRTADESGRSGAASVGAHCRIPQPS